MYFFNYLIVNMVLFMINHGNDTVCFYKTQWKLFILVLFHQLLIYKWVFLILYQNMFCSHVALEHGSITWGSFITPLWLFGFEVKCKLLEYKMGLLLLFICSPGSIRI